MVRVLNQLWRLLKLCLAGKGGKLGLVLYAVVLTLELSQILVSLRMIEWSKAFYDALQQVNGEEALRQVGVFGIIVVFAVSLTLGSTFVRQHLEIIWRRALTSAAMDRWLANRAYLRVRGETGPEDRGANLDNPDQRIADDCRYFLAGPMSEHGGGIGLIPLSIDLITNVVAIFSYIAVLWSLASFPLSLAFAGMPVEIPRYMVWAAFLYVILCTGLTHVLGRPLKSVYMQQQKREADFRFGLVRVRENAEAVALSNGETTERRELDHRFGGIVTNWRRLINAEIRLLSFTYPYRFTVLRIPTFLALPAFFGGAVTFGGLMQLASSFSQVVTTLSWFIFAYRPLADLVAASSRLDAFLAATEVPPPAPAGLEHTTGNGPDLTLSGIRLATPDGRRLLDVGNLRVAPGEAVWLSGASGLGKTTLLKTIAGIWPHAEGQIAQGAGSHLFLPQKPYFPIGSLYDAAAYPSDATPLNRNALRESLTAVGLSGRLEEAESGSDTGTLGLSGGEQQRLALARLLALRPDWAFLDEATSALDVAAEAELFALLRRELPNTAFIVVSHRKPQGLGTLRTVELSSGEATPTGVVGEPAFA